MEAFKLKHGPRFSKEQMEILKWVFLHRGITTRQLLAAKRPAEFPPHSENPDVENKEKSVRKLIGKLLEHGLVAEKVIPKSKAHYTYLTEDGLELISTALKIPTGNVGTGYNGDYGDFNYELYVPPATKVAHHLSLVDFFLMLDHLKAKYPNLDIDYRDNRYVSEKYVLLDQGSRQGTRKFMPDGEVKLSGRLYPVEIDMGSERFKELVEKFEKYAEFLETLKEQGRPLPNGIFFISGSVEDPAQFKRRWDTVSAAFLQGMERWAPHINLIGGTINCVERIILSESRGFAFHEQKLMDKLSFYTKTKGTDYVGTEYGELPVPKQDFTANISITQVGDQHQVFFYEPVSGFETKALARVRAFHKWISKTKMPEFQKVSEVIPVFYHSGGQPFTFNFKKFADQESLESLFNLTYWMDVNGPTWTDIYGERIRYSNPLLSRVT